MVYQNHEGAGGKGYGVNNKYCREEKRICEEIKSHKALIVYQRAYELLSAIIKSLKQ